MAKPKVRRVLDEAGTKTGGTPVKRPRKSHRKEQVVVEDCPSSGFVTGALPGDSSPGGSVQSIGSLTAVYLPDQVEATRRLLAECRGHITTYVFDDSGAQPSESLGPDGWEKVGESADGRFSYYRNADHTELLSQEKRTPGLKVLNSRPHPAWEPGLSEVIALFQQLAKWPEEEGA